MKRLLLLLCVASLLSACDEAQDLADSHPTLYGKRPLAGKALPGTTLRALNDPDPVD